MRIKKHGFRVNYFNPYYITYKYIITTYSIITYVIVILLILLDYAYIIAYVILEAKTVKSPELFCINKLFKLLFSANS